MTTLMADDLEVTVLTVDVLDWLASMGLTLRPDDGDATVPTTSLLKTAWTASQDRAPIDTSGAPAYVRGEGRER